jgi:hypothetical protein
MTHNRQNITCKTRQSSTKIKHKHPTSATHAASQHGPSITVQPLKQSIPTSLATTGEPEVHTTGFLNCAETVTHRSSVICVQSQAVFGRKLLIPPELRVRFHAGYPCVQPARSEDFGTGSRVHNRLHHTKRNRHSRHNNTCKTKQTSTEATHQKEDKHPTSATHAISQNGPSRTADPLKQHMNQHRKQPLQSAEPSFWLVVARNWLPTSVRQHQQSEHKSPTLTT